MSPKSEHQITCNFVLLEDEKEILEDLYFKMSDKINEKNLSYPVLNNDNNIIIQSNLTKVDNLADTEIAINNNKCDVLIADFSVKDKKGSTTNCSCLPLLREIKKRMAFIPVIGHTAFPELLETANLEKLTIETIDKADPNSVKIVVEKSKIASQIVILFRKQLINAFYALKNATFIKSLIDHQQALDHARNMFLNIEIPSNLPLDYRKALTTLKPILFRLSSIKSEAFGLNLLSPKFIEIVEPLIKELSSSIFSYEQHAIPTFSKLEALGFNVFIRIDDDDF